MIVHILVKKIFKLPVFFSHLCTEPGHAFSCAPDVVSPFDRLSLQLLERLLTKVSYEIVYDPADDLILLKCEV